ALTPPTREGVQTIFKEFDKGFGDGPSGRSLDALGPAMRRIDPGLDSLRGVSPGDLTETIRSTSRLMGALAKNEVDLVGTVDNASTTLGVTAARRAAVGSTLRNGAATLDVTRKSMVNIRGTLDELDPRAQELRPGARILDDASRSLRPALAELRPALADARPALKDLRPALTRLRSASRTGVPFMKNISPTLTRMQDVILPGLEKKAPLTGLKLYEEIGPVASSVSSSASLFDVYGHTQRFQAINGGLDSLAALPCSADLLKGGIKCADLKEVLAGVLAGAPGAKATPASGSRSASAPRSGGGTSSGKDAGPAQVGKGTMSQIQRLLKGGL
ncbi:MAG: hypothetical protein H0V81_07960, partial [Solirubrobacterales bacterium]|nr:hypothetical protein [Solirubrobacterales bacterium]